MATKPGDRIRADANKLLNLAIGHRPPTVEEFLEHFFRAAGGPKLVAKMLFTEFQSAKPGSMLRTRVLEMVVRALRYNEGKDKTVEMGLLSDDDLDDMIDQKMNNLAARDDVKQLGPAQPVEQPAVSNPGIHEGSGI
jgi:hypothetical protein